MMNLRIILITVPILFFPLLSSASTFFDRNHTVWNDIVKEVAVEQRVDYELLQVRNDDLERYIQSLEFVHKPYFDLWPDEDKIAFWLNVYNAATARIILLHYPIEPRPFFTTGIAYPKNSIQQIHRVWERPIVKVFGIDMSLNYIEHEILREQFTEPRIHFALVCASIGCPELRNEAYVGKDLHDQLDDQTFTFVNDPKKIVYDGKSHILNLSKIFKWFAEDFESSGGVNVFVKKYLIRKDADNLTPLTPVKYMKYDWGLNDKIYNT